jgi:hypothetical protein
MAERGAKGRSHRIVLAVGELTTFVRHELGLGARHLDCVDDSDAAVERMAETAYDVVVADCQGRARGRRLAATIKGSLNLLQADPVLLSRARRNHPLTPFFLFEAAAASGWEVVVLPPALVYRDDGSGMPFVEAVLRFDLTAWVGDRALLA